MARQKPRSTKTSVQRAQGPWQGGRLGEDFSAALSDVRCCWVPLNNIDNFVSSIPAGVPRSVERRYQGPRSRKWQSGRWKIVWNCQELEFCAHLYHTTVYLVFSSLGIYVCGFTMFCPHLLCTTEHLPNFILVLNSMICRR